MCALRRARWDTSPAGNIPRLLPCLSQDSASLIALTFLGTAPFRWKGSTGIMTTWVYAEERTAEGILAGIQSGHVTISYAPSAARIDFSADADSD